SKQVGNLPGTPRTLTATLEWIGDSGLALSVPTNGISVTWSPNYLVSTSVQRSQSGSSETNVFTPGPLSATFGGPNAWQSANGIYRIPVSPKLTTLSTAQVYGEPAPTSVGSLSSLAPGTYFFDASNHVVFLESRVGPFGPSYAPQAAANGTTAGQSVTTYRVYKSTDGTTYSLVGATGGLNASYDVNNLQNRQTYAFEVTALNGAGEGPPTSPLWAMPHAMPPGAPVALTLSPGNGFVDVAWSMNASTGGAAPTDYVIYAGSNPGLLVNLSDTGGSNTTFRANGLTNGGSFYFASSAVNTAGEGPLGPSQGVMPVAGAAPIAPTLAHAAGSGSSPSIQLSWTPNSQGPAATDYNVYAGLTGTSRVLVGDTGG